MKRLLAAAIALALVAVVASAGSVHADTAIRVLSSNAQVNFPTDVAFTLDAEAPATITDVSLQVATPGLRFGAFPRNVRPDFTPGTTIKASWTWRRYGSDLPPGTEISYRWRLTDADGALVETPAASVRVDDSRFQWHELREGMVTLRWYRGDDDFGRQLLQTATDTVTELSRERGVDLRAPVTIHVYGTQDDLLGALPNLPRWAGGISLGEYDTVLVPIAPNGLSEGRKTLAHELTHQLIYQITFNPALGSRVPVWLNEGLAVVSEGPTSATNRRVLDRAVADDDVPTLRSLTGSFSGLQGGDAVLAYAAAESAVRYLLHIGGADAMRTLLGEFGAGRTPDDALQRAYGKTQDEIEDGWRIDLGLKPRDRSPAPTFVAAAPATAPQPRPDAAPAAAAVPHDRSLSPPLVVALALIGLLFITALALVGVIAGRRLAAEREA